MKLFSYKSSSLVVPLCTLAGVIMRLLLEFFGIDEKGLYLTGHPLYIGLFVLSGLVLIWLLLSSRNVTGQLQFSASVGALVANVIAAVGILLTDGYELFICAADCFTVQDAASQATLILSAACFVVGILAAVALVFAGILQYKGKNVHFLFYAVLTVYLLLHPLSQYRMWSSDPQLLKYCFQLLASVCLLLTAYHRTALAAGKPDYKRYFLFSGLAFFFCGISITGENLFYFAMLQWLIYTPKYVHPEEAC